MADRPNLVFIFSDQQRADTMACYGNDWLNVPNLNALADQSFVFENAYVTQPVCTPARASIMTGLYPHAAGPIVNQLVLPRETPVIAEMLPDEYYCGYYGKWHLGDDVIRQHGFDEWVSTEDGHIPEYTQTRVPQCVQHILALPGRKWLRARPGACAGQVHLLTEDCARSCRRSIRWRRSLVRPRSRLHRAEQR